MTEVAIHRCVLRIRRISGWAWGSASGSLLDAARRALPELLASCLPGITGDVEVRVREPIKIRIATTVGALATIADPLAPGTQALRALIAERLSTAFGRAVRDAPRQGQTAVDGQAALAAAETEDHPAAAPVATGDDATRRDAELATPRAALRALWRSGALAELLVTLDEPLARRLHDLALDARGTSPQAGPALALAVEAGATLAASQPQIGDIVRQRLALAAALLDQRPVVSPAELRAAVDAALPLALTETPGPLTATRSPDGPSSDAATPRAVTTQAPVVATGAPATGEVEIRSALPFLLLPALHHAGWLAAAGALLAAADLQAAAFALAAGLAAKVLDPLQRGWLRSRADRMVVAAFCGSADTSAESLADAQIAAAAARLGPILPALDVTLRHTPARARRPRPSILWRDGRGFTLLDTDGMVALGTAAELRPLLLGSAPTPILVPAAFADPGTLEQIELANARFVSDAPRGRGESWRVFSGADRRLITNDFATPIPRLVAETAGLDATLALAEELATFLAERPALPRHPPGAFEATVTLAATAALADLGARLFPAEATTPVLALSRFRDLDARVRFEPERVIVRVPLGRRHADLMRHGVLGELATVPWLGGRTLSLGGG